ncbi:hypothetical protein [Bradyrhizobium sp. LHD-71]|uniref:hypothetical protein n=1 Tax=Bradyrhizobium sp. LHD-71 TaxID=3072141 RepID=UPI00280D4071|nr:hypothetical protein [Bradyrhizobium sp. LHD-71]MDQ8728576.1 hypothetical protein [Bradyrhizobium sp. LHD-71]
MEQQAQPQPARSLPVDRLRDYLRQLAPAARTLLMREYERALERGDDVAVASFVLGELRRMNRVDDVNDRSRAESVARQVFACLDPFLTDDDGPRPGQVRRASLEPAWLWLSKTVIVDAAAALENSLSASVDTDQAIRKFQIAAAEAIAVAASHVTRDHDRIRGLARVGSPSAVEDLPVIGVIFANREALDTFHARLPKIIRTFAETQIASVTGHLTQFPSLQRPDVLPMALSLLMQRLISPWRIIRLAISIVGSDEEGRIASSPFGIAVSMALEGLGRLVDELRIDIRRGQFGRSAHHLKTLHDGLRDLRTELDTRPDSQWGRQLSAIRTDVSDALTSEIESVPGRVRRLLRQRPDKDIIAGAKLDPSEIDETSALVDFVAACRNYASELAINEVTLRAHSDVQHYVETATEALVESLRTGDGRIRAFRQVQTETAIRFCESIFGHEYASLMTKAAEVALNGERKTQKTG